MSRESLEIAAKGRGCKSGPSGKQNEKQVGNRMITRSSRQSIHELKLAKCVADKKKFARSVKKCWTRTVELPSTQTVGVEKNKLLFMLALDLMPKFDENKVRSNLSVKLNRLDSRVADKYIKNEAKNNELPSQNLNEALVSVVPDEDNIELIDLVSDDEVEFESRTSDKTLLSNDEKALQLKLPLKKRSNVVSSSVNIIDLVSSEDEAEPDENEQNEMSVSIFGYLDLEKDSNIFKHGPAMLMPPVTPPNLWRTACKPIQIGWDRNHTPVGFRLFQLNMGTLDRRRYQRLETMTKSRDENASSR